jgi:putative CRISPR-associated protein (TIGR02620 family)
MSRGLIVTRHPAAVEWIRRRVHGLPLDVIQHLDETSLKGPSADDETQVTDVFGVVPLHWIARLQAAGVRTWLLEMDMPADFRNAQLSGARMDEFGARLVSYELRSAVPWTDRSGASRSHVAGMKVLPPFDH